MRTVLAVDELLARAVGAKLPGVVEICTRARMRDDGDEVVADLVMMVPSVLVIGAKKWDPLDLLEAWLLPPEIPVVLVVPHMSEDIERRASALELFSVVPADRSVRATACLACECRLAWAWLQGRHARPLVPDARPPQAAPANLPGS